MTKDQEKDLRDLIGDKQFGKFELLMNLLRVWAFAFDDDVIVRYMPEYGNAKQPAVMLKFPDGKEQGRIAACAVRVTRQGWSVDLDLRGYARDIADLGEGMEEAGNEAVGVLDVLSILVCGLDTVGNLAVALVAAGVTARASKSNITASIGDWSVTLKGGAKYTLKLNDKEYKGLDFAKGAKFLLKAVLKELDR